MSRLRLSRLNPLVLGFGAAGTSLVFNACGYSITDSREPLGTGFVMTLIGGFLLMWWVAKHGGLRLGEFGLKMWGLTFLLGADITVLLKSFLVASAELGLAATASVGAGGVLTVGMWRVLTHLKTPLGRRHLVCRLTAYSAILVWMGINGIKHINVEAITAALLCAVCYWGMTTIVGMMTALGLEDPGVALAYVLSAIALGVWLCIVGADSSFTESWLPIGRALIAGLLTVFAPSLLQNVAYRHVPYRDAAVVLALNPAVATIVSQLGVLGGLLGSNQLITWGWFPLVFLIAAAVTNSRLAPLPDKKPAR